MTVKGRHVGARAMEASILTGSSKEIATQAIFATRKDFSNSASFLSGNKKKTAMKKKLIRILMLRCPQWHNTDNDTVNEEVYRSTTLRTETLWNPAIMDALGPTHSLLVDFPLSSI